MKELRVKGGGLKKQDEQIETLIIMSSYNGAAFIAEQLQSIIDQEYKQWTLLLRDDGSTDDTLSMFQEISKQDSRLKLLTDNKARLGAAQSFHALMRAAAESSSNYIVFSDQDDVWFPDKLSKQIALMKNLEIECAGMPILIHSDMEVVDADLNQMAPSFMSYQGIHHEDDDSLRVLLVQNYVTGCTVVVNRRLLDVALPMPDSALMHDWWLALVAAASGKIGFVDESLIQYRQHGSNTVGAKPLRALLDPRTWSRQWQSGRVNLRRSIDQAQSLAERLERMNSHEGALRLIRSYALLLKQQPVARVHHLIRLGLHAQSQVRNLLLRARLMSLK